MPEPAFPSAAGGPVDLSLIVPVHDEEGNLERLWEEIRALLARVGGRSEVLFVNDGSEDGTGEVLDRLRVADPRIRVLDHDRNHGLTAALDTGFRHARGAVVGMLDADLQNPPGEIEKLLPALARADLVIGWRRDRDDPWLKRVSSRIANGYRNWRTRERVHDTACGLKVFRREVLQRIKLWNGMHRFLPTLARMEGFRVEEVVVQHRRRGSGRSHYGVWNRLWKGLRDVRAVRWMWRNRLRAVATERPPPARPPR
jgi:glycosyltransferase involved in cell wall biosynthesis